LTRPSKVRGRTSTWAGIHAHGPTEARPLNELADATSNVVPLPLPPAEPEVEERLPRRARAYIFLVFALGLFAIGTLAPQLDTSDMAGFAVFAVLAMAFGRTRITIYGDTTISIAVVAISLSRSCSDRRDRRSSVRS